MKTEFKANILSKIRSENIVPIPKSHFQKLRRFLWIWIAMALFFSVIFGIFFIDDSLDFLRFGQGENEWQLLFFPPVFWGFFLLGFVIIGIFGFRKTVVGYRYDILRNVLVWGVSVLVFAGVFRGLGIWPLVHSYVADHIPFLADTVYRQSSWNDPTVGRLAGTIQSMNSNEITISDLSGSIWTITTSNAHIGKKAKLEIWQKIRITWVATTTTTFDAERVMPWFGQGTGDWFWNFLNK